MLLFCSEEMPLPAIKNGFKSVPSSTNNSMADPEDPVILVPCPSCSRTFSKAAIARHSKVCEKVHSQPKRTVFKISLEGENSKGSSSVPNTPMMARKRQPKPATVLVTPDALQKCPFCDRKFGVKVRETPYKISLRRGQRRSSSSYFPVIR